MPARRGRLQRDVKTLVKPPIHCAPAFRIGDFVIVGKDCFGRLDVALDHIWHGQLERTAFERDTDVQELAHIIPREGGHHSASVGKKGYQPLCLELTQVLPDRDAAGAKTFGKFFLTKLGSWGTYSPSKIVRRSLSRT